MLTLSPLWKTKKKNPSNEIKENPKWKSPFWEKKQGFKEDEKIVLEARGKFGSWKEVGNCSDMRGVLCLLSSLLVKVRRDDQQTFVKD